jgi:hypothetical protein
MKEYAQASEYLRPLLEFRGPARKNSYQFSTLDGSVQEDLRKIGGWKKDRRLSLAGDLTGLVAKAFLHVAQNEDGRFDELFFSRFFRQFHMYSFPVLFMIDRIMKRDRERRQLTEPGFVRIAMLGLAKVVRMLEDRDHKLFEILPQFQVVSIFVARCVGRNYAREFRKIMRFQSVSPNLRYYLAWPAAFCGDDDALALFEEQHARDSDRSIYLTGLAWGLSDQIHGQPWSLPELLRNSAGLLDRYNAKRKKGFVNAALDYAKKTLADGVCMSRPAITFTTYAQIDELFKFIIRENITHLGEDSLKVFNAIVDTIEDRKDWNGLGRLRESILMRSARDCRRLFGQKTEYYCH